MSVTLLSSALLNSRVLRFGLAEPRIAPIWGDLNLWSKRGLLSVCFGGPNRLPKSGLWHSGLAGWVGGMSHQAWPAARYGCQPSIASWALSFPKGTTEPARLGSCPLVVLLVLSSAGRAADGCQAAKPGWLILLPSWHLRALGGCNLAKPGWPNCFGASKSLQNETPKRFGTP